MISKTCLPCLIWENECTSAFQRAQLLQIIIILVLVLSFFSSYIPFLFLLLLVSLFCSPLSISLLFPSKFSFRAAFSLLFYILCLIIFIFFPPSYRQKHQPETSLGKTVHSLFTFCLLFLYVFTYKLLTGSHFYILILWIKIMALIKPPSSKPQAWILVHMGLCRNNYYLCF